MPKDSILARANGCIHFHLHSQTIRMQISFVAKDESNRKRRGKKTKRWIVGIWRMFFFKHNALNCRSAHQFIVYQLQRKEIEQQKQDKKITKWQREKERKILWKLKWNWTANVCTASTLNKINEQSSQSARANKNERQRRRCLFEMMRLRQCAVAVLLLRTSNMKNRFENNGVNERRKSFNFDAFVLVENARLRVHSVVYALVECTMREWVLFIRCHI